MAESIAPELELQCLRVLMSAPENYQREIRARIRKLLLAATSPEQAHQFVEKYLVRIQEKISRSQQSRDQILGGGEEEGEENHDNHDSNNNNNNSAAATSTGEPVEKQHRAEEDQ